jgi:N-acylneuraminate cytidylyltransferase
LAVIPARGGSKSIARKNVRPFAGSPLLCWSIAAAQESRLVDRIIVSTDAPEIREIACDSGAEVPFLRPADLARDDTPDLPVFDHVLNWLDRHDGWRPDILVQLRPTSPLRPPGLVDQAVVVLVSHSGADSLRAVSSPSQNPYKMWRRVGSTPYLVPLLAGAVTEAYNQPRQSLPPTLWQTGHLDAFHRETVLLKGSLSGDRILPLHLPVRYAIDIDTLEHWDFAEWIVERGGMPIVRPQPVPAGLEAS